MSKCERFLELSDRSSDEFTIRAIDEQIHEYVVNTPTNYKRKQERLIDLVKGCEVPIFNDSRIKYLSHRPHFEGITGVMSNILTGTFYYLYYHLLKNTPVVVNADADLLTLFYAGLLIDYTKLPREDRSVIQKIISILLEKSSKELFTVSWWDSLQGNLEVIISDLNKTRNNAQMWRVFQSLLGGEGNSVFNYGPYENTVNYVHHDLRFLDTQINSVDDIELKQVRSLFINDDSNNNLLLINGFLGGNIRTKRKRKNRRKSLKTASKRR